MNVTGTWVNTKSSVLTITQHGNEIKGTFDSGVSDGCQVINAPVTGWVNGDRVAFAATYEIFGTVVAWVGQIKNEPGNPTMDAHFLHESDIPEGQEKENLWLSTRTGSDQFTKK
ncbi:MAG: avidin/streptavidin family protein [Cyanobacteria bacterium P01_H01_bin.15]